MEAFDKIRGHTIYAKVLPRNPTMIDLGANHGDFSNSFLAKFGGDRALYEANPKLAKRLASNPSLRVFNIAVAGHSDTVRFNIAANDEASSILELPDNSVYNATKTETVEVPANTLDAICDKIDKPIIDLIKIDIEGAEIEVLKSCSIETLRRIGQITVEFHCDPSFSISREAIRTTYFLLIVEYTRFPDYAKEFG
jgi:FkbM family methyltransferase